MIPIVFLSFLFTLSIMKKPHRQPLIDSWLEHGRSIPWMELAVDPSFTRESFIICQTRRELIAHILKQQHPLGQAFALQDICFINLNSLPGADEWLAIKGRTAIGNISLRIYTELGDLDRTATRRRLMTVVDLLQQCSEEECAASGFRENL